MGYIDTSFPPTLDPFPQISDKAHALYMETRDPLTGASQMDYQSAEAALAAHLEGKFFSLEGKKRSHFNRGSSGPSPSAAHMPSIVQAASTVCCIPVHKIRSASRKEELVFVRQLITAIARIEFSIPFHEIGTAINRSHTTIIKSTFPDAQANAARLNPLIKKALAVMETI